MMAPLSVLPSALAIILCQSSLSEAFTPPSHRSFVAKSSPLATRLSHPHPRPRPSNADVVELAESVSIGAGGGFPVGINTTAVDHFTADDTQKSRPPFPIVLWRFTRPHTIIGSAIAIPSIFLLAAPTYSSFFTWTSFVSLLYAAFPSLLMNLYITGLNQITDVEIDKINKPELPIAKGDLKVSTACVVVLVALAISLAMSVMHPIFSTSGLQIALWGSALLGTLYSLPPFRMKRHPLLAAFCIVAVRGTIINAGFYSHAASSAFGGGVSGVLNCLMHDPKCTLSSIFFGVFGLVIALMKDVPDAHGDRIFNIRSFTVRMGQKRVFGAMKNLLTALFGAFGGALIKWATMAPAASVVARRSLVGLGCLAAGWSVNSSARGVDAEDSGEVYDYYMHLWKLFYMSYLALPFAK